MFHSDKILLSVTSNIRFNSQFNCLYLTNTKYITKKYNILLEHSVLIRPVALYRDEYLSDYNIFGGIWPIGGAVAASSL